MIPFLGTFKRLLAIISVLISPVLVLVGPTSVEVLILALVHNLEVENLDGSICQLILIHPELII